jgi:hypothetical protein
MAERGGLVYFLKDAACCERQEAGGREGVLQNHDMNTSTAGGVVVELSHGHLYLLSRIQCYGYGLSQAR